MGGSCQPCQPGYYNDAADDSQCQECPTGKDTVHMNSTACGKPNHVITELNVFSGVCLCTGMKVPMGPMCNCSNCSQALHPAPLPPPDHFKFIHHVFHTSIGKQTGFLRLKGLLVWNTAVYR